MSDDSVEFEGYDGPVDDGPSFGGSYGGSRAGIPNPGRRGGKKTLAASSGSRGGRRGKPMSGRGFFPRFSFDPRQLAGSVSSLLAISVIGVFVIAVILYITFLSGAVAPAQHFYGALLAAMAVTVLISYLAVKLLGGAD
ncbi:MAG: hypothetical protein A4E28_00559 [Methanocella sp. PtaU1.Bin125]|nr:MAG: hypothetical protein A4E28_00559 [Methanocella sp. PtaU1.Bin125]